jgi:plastocyanin domain-containing protein
MKAITSIIIALVIMGGLIFLLGDRRKNTTSTQQENIQNVSIVDGKQIIEIKAKGGYSPRVSTAKSGIPTILRFNTKGTFDCSSSIRIPSMNISELLPNSGSKDIDLGTPKVGTLQGSCGMGMYPFQIDFQV